MANSSALHRGASKQSALLGVPRSLSTNAATSFASEHEVRDTMIYPVKLPSKRSRDAPKDLPTQEEGPLR